MHWSPQMNRNLFFGILGLFLTSAAHAQIFGLAALLDPEGSRLFPQSIAAPRHAGKPDPRWRRFNWQFTDLAAGPANFRLYFYDEEEWSARFVAPRIQAQVAELSKTFNFVPPSRFSYILFTSLREFRQANVFFIAEGVQGVTSTTEATMAIPYWGSPEDFDHVSTHEMVHQFQVQKIESLIPGGATAEVLPLWFIEGQSEYYSLNGIDPETRAFITDVLTHPNKDRGYTIPKFVENGAFDFVHLYKIGQAKIDFLEKEFGAGASQRVFNKIAPIAAESPHESLDVFSQTYGVTSEELEKRWRSYLDRNYLPKPPNTVSVLPDSSTLSEVGPDLDLFRISPDGKILCTREVDSLTGIVSIYLRRLDAPKKKTEAVHDGTRDTTGLYFLQNPSIAVSNDRVAYAAEAALGPELEFRAIHFNSSGEIKLGVRERIALHKHGLLQASSLSFSPDGRTLAFTALNASGWTNVYLLEAPFQPKAVPKPIFRDPYDWKSIQWSEEGLFASSNRTSDSKYAIFKIDPKNNTAVQLTSPLHNERNPEPVNGGFLYDSDETGVSQIHFVKNQARRPLTQLSTGIKAPVFRNGILYGIALHSGRYQIVKKKLPELTAGDNKEIFPVEVLTQNPNVKTAQPWAVQANDFATGTVQRYRPFRNSGTRIDGIMGYFASGGAAGIGAGISDLFRDYNVAGEFSILGSIKYTNAYVFLSGSRGRPKWTTGAYAIVQPRLDRIFPSDDFIRTYLHREYGVLGALQYPLSTFSYVDTEIRIGGVKRSDISDPAVAAEWEARNPGTEVLLSPVLRWGYDGILYETFSGPLKGFGILAESETSIFPKRQTVAERVRLDAARYFQLTGRTILALQAMSGASWGKDFGNPFLISSDDILRGYNFFDTRLYGNFFTPPSWPGCLRSRYRLPGPFNSLEERFFFQNLGTDLQFAANID